MFFGMLGHIVNFGPEHAVLSSNFRQSCNWAAITCIVVTAPVIGKVAQVAFDRLLGTAVGGFIGMVAFTIGFHLFGAGPGGSVFISAVAGLTVWATTYLAFKHSLDQLARFMQLTYCIVAFGAKPDKGASLLAMLRIGGIFAGGLLSVLLAVVVLPRSASVEALREMRKALKALHDLNKEVWALSGVDGTGTLDAKRRPFRKHHRHGYSALHEAEEQQAIAQATAAAAAGVGEWPLRQSASDSALPNVHGGAAVGGGMRHSHLSADNLNLLVQHDEELDSREAAIEKLFTAVYSTLDKVDDNLAQTKGEIYVWHFWGRYFFLPGVHWFPARGRWQVPKKDLQALATCLRRVARMLWTLLLDFEEGFGSDMQAVLRTYYPSQLLSELATYQARAILISDARARTAVFNAKRRRTSIAGSRQMTLQGLRSSRDFGPGPGTAHGSRASRDYGQLHGVRPSRDFGPQAPPGQSGVGPAGDAGRGNESLRPGAVAAAATGQEAELADLRRLDGYSRSSQFADPAAAPTSAAALEKAPLLPPQHTLSSAPSGAVAGGGSPGPGAAGATAGIFISRLLSGLPGSAVALPLPPRRFLQGQAQQGQPVPFAGAAAELPMRSPALSASGTVPRPATAGSTPARTSLQLERSEDVDILGGLKFELSEGSSVAPSMLAVPSGSSLHASTATLQQPQRQQQGAAPGLDWNQAAQGLGGTRARPHVALPTIPSCTDMASAAATVRGGSGSGGSVSGSGGSPPVELASPFENAADGRDGIGVGGEWHEVLLGGGGAAAAATVAAATTAAVTVADRPPGRGSPAASASAFATAPVHDMLRAAVPPLAPQLQLQARGGAATADTSVRSTGSGAGAAVWAGATAGLLRGGGGGGEMGALGAGGGLRNDGAFASISLQAEPITFPPTEEGYLSQVRWYSFQFVMDELVEELEEAFFAASAVLRQLPYPVGS
ncbi:hypothetical protein GPECTOR_26g596 [Gonium pectorale]|uniref:Integral membrane bound transporter domain-containing protein n=1 Tax=Gonium pectorale TaxID=33097 RepID=A0A150GFX7_GONPE|nr:hypothetical protein GPECTOR_26g596 [Gonium pectorale]|eukprot:KXZ48693.1 hypothetical protein GPECTOR_26g596 [Gonium pectorale]